MTCSRQDAGTYSEGPHDAAKTPPCGTGSVVGPRQEDKLEMLSYP